MQSCSSQVNPPDPSLGDGVVGVGDGVVGVGDGVDGVGDGVDGVGDGVVVRFIGSGTGNVVF